MSVQPIKNWPPAERPREKLLAHGVSSLSSTELLALVLRNGAVGECALTQARAVLAASGGSLRRMAKLGVADLCRLRGIGPAKAAEIQAVLEIAKRFGQEELAPGVVFESSYDIFCHFRERFADEKSEHFFVVLLDIKHRKIRDVCVSQGSLSSTIVHPREVFLPVIRESAAAVIFVHNHPSGDPSPSRADIELTRRLRQVGEVVGVSVLDHIIIGRGRYMSFVDDGYW